ncbi:MAG: hypothetical protein COZ06_27220 [Armatimonadetes bacterium CG_4_10_14_3_um_filter_66_18]|nr:hypothetical protein [Armatimonadota bacterium]NCO96296.1 hypothetical protein [Armatimonadota bacterium]NDK17122.1 hypothetical protein [Armatimonadota bacterium]PIX37137.1 MAG: hypothetical protein COZ57_35910 [Armatimonadetes bacterium CG_4_8_14_3_um_filter_66_20]PIY41052.1 MAG: hypothetical protein COZ06_27220 [Armatimonadetes bacterium CG_4_10_14_3_um_filter_66_18]
MGNEVLIHIRTLACIIGMDLQVLPPGQVRLSKGPSRWCEITARSQVVKGNATTVMVGKTVAPRYAHC